jgi:hypothetical protein
MAPEQSKDEKIREAQEIDMRGQGLRNAIGRRAKNVNVMDVTEQTE